MQDIEQTMTYVILRDTRGNTRGFVRLKSTPEQLGIFLRAETASADRPIRLLLISAGDEGAALDLGQPLASADGSIRWGRTHPPEDLRLWDAAVLAEDWPSPTLIAAGWLRDAAAPLWRIQDTIARFLRLPPPQNP